MGNLKSKLFLGLGIITLIMSMLSPVLPAMTKQALAVATPILAGDQFKWISYNTIQDMTAMVNFVDGDTTDGTHSFSYSNSSDGAPQCDNSGVTYGNNNTPLQENTVGSAIIDFPGNWNDNPRPSSGYLYVVTSSSNGSSGISQCVATLVNNKISISHVADATSDFKYNDSYTISPNSDATTPSFTIVAKDDQLYTNNNTKATVKNKVVYATNNPTGNCPSYIAVDPNTPYKGIYYEYNIHNGSSCELGYWLDSTPSSAHGGSMPPHTWVAGSATTVTITQLGNWKKSEATNPPKDKTVPSDQPRGGGGSTPVDTNDQCEGGVPVLGWIICAGVNLVADFATWVDGQIGDLLTVNSNTYSTNTGYKTAWSAIRILATIALVGIALFMIIAQIFNFDFVSAYTVKKIVPRLVIAIILIQLSWFLFTAAVDIVNVVGSAIGDLIAAPFGGANSLNHFMAISNAFNAKAGTASQAGVFSFMGLAIVGGIGAIGGGFGILAIAIGVLIAVIIAFATLVLRQVVIVVLLLIAPLAIVAWILPNTQNWWKKYWELTSKLLIMYPLIMGMLMLGKVFAYTAAQNPLNGAGETVNFFVVLIAYFGPLYFVPSMIKASGTVFSKAAEGISGAGGKLKNIRPVRRVEDAKKRNIEAREYNSKRLGNTWATGGGRLGRSKTGRAIGRYWAGTAGSTGHAADQLRQQEKVASIQNAEAELQSNVEKLGLYNYKDQVNYMKTAAMGGGTMEKADHTKLNVESTDASTMQSATTWLADRQFGDELREAKVAQFASGRQDVWSGAMSTHAGKALGSAADAVGKPFETLTPEQTVTQDASTLRNLTAYYDEQHKSFLEADNAMNIAHRQGNAKEEAIQRAKRDNADSAVKAIEANMEEVDSNEGTRRLITGEKRKFVDYIKNKGVGTRPDADKDFLGKKLGDEGYHPNQKIMPKID